MFLLTFFSYLLCLIPSLYTIEPCLVFVHLGNNLPSYGSIAISQAHLFNPNSKIYLLANPPLVPSEAELVLLDQIPWTEEHLRFKRVNRIDGTLSDGLWLYALERFFTLYDFMVDRDLKTVFHLENDTMLYVDLHELLPFLEGVRLAAPFQSAAGCIPCFVYIKDRESLAFLVRNILEQMEGYKGAAPHISVSDMSALAKFQGKYGESFFTVLPTLMGEYGKFHSKLKSRYPKDNLTPLTFLSKNETLFAGYIFDAATLGIYLSGNDRKFNPNNGPGTIHNRSLFNPSHFSYTWEMDEMGRRVPWLMFRGEKYKIANLHIHSKMLGEFASF